MTDDSWAHFQNMLGNIAAATGYKLPEARTSLYWAVLQHKIPDDDFMSRLSMHIVETTSKFPSLPEILSYPEFRAYDPPALVLARWVKDTCGNTECMDGIVIRDGLAYRCPLCKAAPEWMRIAPGAVTRKSEDYLAEEIEEKKTLVAEVSGYEEIREALTEMGVAI